MEEVAEQSSALPPLQHSPQQGSLGDPASDLRLVRRALAREQEALHTLGQRLVCVPPMVARANRNLALGLTEDQQSDLVQDVVLALWQKLETFEGRSTLEGWTKSFVHNQLRNRIRQFARQRGSAVRSMDDLAGEPAVPMQEDIPDRQALESALASLPPLMEEVLRMKHFDGLLFREIAIRVQASENTIKTRYYRGLREARKALLAAAGEGHTDG